MTETVENLLLELLQKLQAEQAATRDQLREVMSRLGGLESMIARIGRDNAHAYAEQVDDRHSVDALKLRIERIEKRLELTS